MSNPIITLFKRAGIRALSLLMVGSAIAFSEGAEALKVKITLTEEKTEENCIECYINGIRYRLVHSYFKKETLRTVFLVNYIKTLLENPERFEIESTKKFGELFLQAVSKFKEKHVVISHYILRFLDEKEYELFKSLLTDKKYTDILGLESLYEALSDFECRNLKSGALMEKILAPKCEIPSSDKTAPAAISSGESSLPAAASSNEPSVPTSSSDTSLASMPEVATPVVGTSEE